MDYDRTLVKSPAGWVWLELGGCGFLSASAAEPIQSH